ncbi:hypothetical protein MMC14_008390 [Varicellaria rhodocarpa]|nr:hypothetical protein [Varicellaria rhodocarpa]
MATIVLGAQWGDEGKGKLIDILSRKAHLCARACGGSNAGHTVVVNEVSCAGRMAYGVVLHVPTFFDEIEANEVKGIETTDRLFISDRAHVVLDLHQLVDGLEEAELGKDSIGTTKKGIGPCYGTKALRSGIRVGDIFDEMLFESKLRKLAKGFQKRYGELLEYDIEEEINRFKTYRIKLAPYVVDAVSFMASAQQELDFSILVEGANAIMLDIDYGTFPYVTSSSTGIGGVFTGLAISPFRIKEIIGVVKAYTTRVGAGPFPTEQLNEIGKTLQEVGGEIGVTTGRLRRCGWLDVVQLKYSTMVNHYTSLNLTKLDVLDQLSTLKIAVAYKDTETGYKLGSFPANLATLGRVEVVYRDVEGWMESTKGVGSWEELPEKARAYIELVERLIGVPIKWIGTGKEREAMITR